MISSPLWSFLEHLPIANHTMAHFLKRKKKIYQNSIKYFLNSELSSSIFLTPAPYFSGIWDIFRLFHILKEFFCNKFWLRPGFLWFRFLFPSLFYILPIRAADTWFYVFIFLICPSGLRIPAFNFFSPLSPSGPRIPAGSPLPSPKPLAHGGSGCLFFFFFNNFWPIGASDTCFYYFFPCPSGPRIPALIFFLCPSGPRIPA